MFIEFLSVFINFAKHARIFLRFWQVLSFVLKSLFERAVFYFSTHTPERKSFVSGFLIALCVIFLHNIFRLENAGRAFAYQGEQIQSVSTVYSSEGIPLPQIKPSAEHKVPSLPNEEAARKEIVRDLEKILGLERKDVQHIYKMPEMIRKDGSTEVWQYRTDVCVLDIYFLPQSGKNSHKEAVHYDVRLRDSRAHHLEDVHRLARKKSCTESFSGSGRVFKIVDVGAVFKAVAP